MTLDSGTFALFGRSSRIPVSNQELYQEWEKKAPAMGVSTLNGSSSEKSSTSARSGMILILKRYFPVPYWFDSLEACQQELRIF